MHQVEIEFDVDVPLRDGTILRADVYRPADGNDHPVLVQRTPYGKNYFYDSQFDVRVAARRGYIVVIQDTRGRFASEGEWLPWAFEREDGYDTIEWAAQLPGSNGKVGMFGVSYMGSTQWNAAVSQPPHLVTIVPGVTWSDPENGLTFRSGAIELGMNTWWGLGQAFAQYPKVGLPIEQLMTKFSSTIGDIDDLAERVYWELPAGHHPAIERAGQPDIGVARALDDSAASDESRIANRYSDIEVPSMIFAGWNDVFQQGSLDNYIGMRARGLTTRLIVGPWAHTTLGNSTPQVGDVNFGLSSLAPAGSPLTDMHLAWYDHWLKGEPATQAHESGVLIFVMGDNQWRHESDWPLARAEATPLFLTGSSGLSWQPVTEETTPSAYSYDPLNPVLTRGGNTLTSSEFPFGPVDQAATEARDDVLVFTSEPLDADVEVTGRVAATLYVATDGPSTDWVVRLCDVDRNGISLNVVDGILRTAAEPNEVAEVNIDLWSTSFVFKQGHRLRVQVTSSNFPRWDRNTNTSEGEARDATDFRVAAQKIFHDATHPSHLLLPVVPREVDGQV
ncbi:CocE/NonD family hydrolase [Subtercola lobariae]|uniref:X-Pro dipeptidyl-peptidase n=1 Tax=Subtercola lobariae TaxID=1588641 RepID=A0A917EWD5_9MICO|nr:CocE/NonD family hydrolase [Subtercola lobariae]GGF14850.1 X-Pro dipeptidyl-peptidase [Subtercola lobariae]